MRNPICDVMVLLLSALDPSCIRCLSILWH